jgi:uncharacterized coiled-coil protein SlyX
MDTFLNIFWWTIKPAQASVVGGILTVLAAALAVLLGNYVFRRRAVDLRMAMENAVNEAEEKHKAHLQGLNDAVEDIRLKSEKLNELLDVVLERLSSIDSGLGEVADENKSEEEENDSEEKDLIREKFKEAWEIVREKIERAAGEPSIPNKQRIKFLSMSRRNYLDLVHALQESGNLSIDLEVKFREAIKEWNRLRNGKITISEVDVEKMKRAARDIDAINMQKD